MYFIILSVRELGAVNNYFSRRKRNMKIGCVKEIKNNEFRVGLTPDNVRAYVAAGHHVYMEKGAGVGSGFTPKPLTVWITTNCGKFFKR